MRAAFIVLLCCGLATAGCDRISVSFHFGDDDSETGASSAPEQPWLVVNERAIQAKPNRTIYHQVAEPPRAIRSSPVQVAVPREQVPQGIWLVDLAVSEEGEVLKARVVDGPPGIEIDDPLVRTLQGWRFSPARFKGEPVAVYITQRFEVVGDGLGAPASRRH